MFVLYWGIFPPFAVEWIVPSGDAQAVRDNAYSALIEAARFDSTRRSLEELQTVLPRVMELVLEEVDGSPGRATQGLTLLFACTQVESRGHGV